MFDVEIVWDLEDDPKGNVQHILELHDVTIDEVSEVLGDIRNHNDKSRTSGRPMAFGWTTTGKYLGVPFEIVVKSPYTVYPITAFLANPPREKRDGKKRRK